MAQLRCGRIPYGTGMRLREDIRMRINDLDFDRYAIVVREAKGNKDWAVTLPRSLKSALRRQIRAQISAPCNS